VERVDHLWRRFLDEPQCESSELRREDKVRSSVADSRIR
jgi:hypothetical protein